MNRRKALMHRRTLGGRKARGGGGKYPSNIFSTFEQFLANKLKRGKKNNSGESGGKEYMYTKD
jgi:hypothetical protein